MLYKIKDLLQMHNDIYFMIGISNRIIINNNYKGFIILDENLKLIKIIKIFDDIVIGKFFLNDKKDKLVIFINENKYALYFDILNYELKIINLPLYFNKLETVSKAHFSNKKATFLTSDNKYYIIDFISKKVGKINIKDVFTPKEKFIIKEREVIDNGNYKKYYCHLQGKRLYLIIFEHEDLTNIIKYINRMNDNEIIVLLNETDLRIFVKRCNKIFIKDICPSKKYMYTHITFLNLEKDPKLILLSVNKSNIKISKIELFRLDL